MDIDYLNRYKWATIKTRKIVYNPPYAQSKILQQAKLPKPSDKS